MVETSTGTKRRPRRLNCRSCDNCRQRKVRCDGATMIDNQCSNCLAFGEPCTYVQQPGRRGPRSRLVDELRRKIAELELKLRTLSVCSLCSQPIQSSFEAESPYGFHHGSDTAEIDDPTLYAPPAANEEDSDTLKEFTDKFAQWRISDDFFKFKPSFFGSSSMITLALHAVKVKEKYLGSPSQLVRHIRRPMYWSHLCWEEEFYQQQPSFIYPSQDLLTRLIELYFAHVHTTFPVLHRPSFQRDVAEGLHLVDKNFGALLLAVLALGSRYSDDLRCMIDGNPLSSGWKFIAQVQLVHNLLGPTIHAVQFYCLMSFFSLGSSTPHLTWVYLGIGIRLLQWHGRYLRKRDSPNLEDELWNRAFWSIFILEVQGSGFLGRPPAIHIEDYDVDPPLEVDDEYWEQDFVQPPDKISSLSFFAHFARLFEIFGKALRRLHTSKELKTRMGLTSEREKETVVELDSFMNEFLDSIPPHLRWDPNARGLFFEQAALLQITYHCLQITIHRLYIHKQTVVSGPSRFICLRAARSLLSVADTWMKKSSSLASPFLQNPTVIAAVVLLLNIFIIKRAGLSLDIDKDLARVGTAAKLVQSCETRWQAAGRSWELLQELQSLEGYAPVKEPDSSQRPAERRPSDPPDGLKHASESQAKFSPGTSIEQLLAETEAGGWKESLDCFDDELMPLWLAAPMDIDQWNENMSSTDGIHGFNVL